MAFPGGRADLSDQTHPAVAEREALEEVGIRLDPAAFIGSLPQMPVRRAGADTGITLSSFVYYIGTALVPLLPNHEVADAYWISLTHLWEARNSTTLGITLIGATASYPAISYHGNFIWGLSYRVLELFGKAIGLPLPQTTGS
jgi:8-oxo-dGTP pyrophosphatase MutT (NUDIX family)